METTTIQMEITTMDPIGTLTKLLAAAANFQAQLIIQQAQWALAQDAVQVSKHIHCIVQLAI